MWLNGLVFFNLRSFGNDFVIRQLGVFFAFEVPLNLHLLIEQVVKAGQTVVLVRLQGLLHSLLVNYIHLVCGHLGEDLLAEGLGVDTHSGALLA